jgi:hypothetical protein
MTQDEIIEMARQVGVDATGNEYWPFFIEELEAFAKLVAAKEREACVNVIETHRIPVGNSAAGEMACEWTYDALKEIRTAIQARAQADRGEAL